jgi:FtsP/CotA-like multicopper oxidase with cupredoxin domain
MQWMVFLVLLNVPFHLMILILGPIPPGGSFTYTFRATSYGNSWYHSHFTFQYTDGLVGPLVIHGPSSANWDIDLGSVMINDWLHVSAFKEWFNVQSTTGTGASAANGLINGNGKWNDGGQWTNLTFTPGQKHRLRLVNSGTDVFFKVMVDGHTMTVMAADFVPIVPYQTQVLNIGIGNLTI